MANEVLAALYIVRADVSITVRQAALSVWKAVVANTPRVLLEIISVLVKQLIAKLASSIEVIIAYFPFCYYNNNYFSFPVVLLHHLIVSFSWTSIHPLLPPSPPPPLSGPAGGGR